MKHLNRWIYAIIGLIVMLFSGLVYAWSVMSKSISVSRPDWTQSQLSLTFTLVMAFFCIGCLICGFTAKKISAKIFVLAAGILFFAGFMVSSITGDSIITLYLGFGVLGGLGAGFAYNAVMSTVAAWFPDRQGLISGILLMGFGLSSFIIGKVFAAVTPTDGSDAWQATFRILGIIIVAVLVICSFFLVKPEPGYNPGGNTAKKKNVKEPASELKSGQMMKKPAFWCYYLWALFMSAAGLALVSQGSGIAHQIGASVSEGNIATVVGLISVFNGLGRVVFGIVFDKWGHKITMILDMIVFIVAALALIFAIKNGSYGIMTVGFIVGGFAYGGVTPTNSAIIIDFFGRKHYAMNLSIISTNLMFGSFASTIAGRLYDNTQSYLSTVFMMIICVVVGCVAFIGVRRPKAKENKNVISQSTVKTVG